MKRKELTINIYDDFKLKKPFKFNQAEFFTAISLPETTHIVL